MGSLGLEKLKISAIRESVADALRKALLEGRFKPGESLSEPAIAAELQVSRGPVREAMLVLVADGLLCHTQNRGFSVLDFSATDLRQIEAVRIPLESLALESAREHAGPADMETLDRSKDELCRLFAEGDLQGSLRGEVGFHGAIWELSGNPWLVSTLKRIMIPSFTFGTALRMTRPDLSASVLDDLHSLYIRYLKGDTVCSAEECVRLHLGMPSPSA